MAEFWWKAIGQAGPPRAPAKATAEQLSNPYVLEIEAGNFQCCEGCGQAFDRRNLNHVLYHALPGHLPLRRN